jgi:hypothetical protein
MMNTLANHGFLPHDGRNITKVNAVHAFTTALNFNTSLAELMFEMAVIANPEPNATFFTLYVARIIDSFGLEILSRVPGIFWDEDDRG